MLKFINSSRSYHNFFKLPPYNVYQKQKERRYRWSGTKTSKKSQRRPWANAKNSFDLEVCFMSMFDMMPFEHRNHLSYNPFRDLENWERSFFGDWSTGFNTDIKDKGDHYELEADLPGVKKEDIAVDIDGDRMTISAHRSAETEEKDDNSQYLRRERSYGSFSRSFDISNIKSEEISGAYHDGVLTLTLPKKSPTAPSTSRRLDIQ